MQTDDEAAPLSQTLERIAIAVLLRGETLAQAARATAISIHDGGPLGVMELERALAAWHSPRTEAAAGLLAALREERDALPPRTRAALEAWEGVGE